MNTSKKGDRLFYAVKDYLLKQGYTIVKGAASKSYPKGSSIDAIAFRKGEGYLIQLKKVRMSENARLQEFDKLVKYQGYIFLKPLVLTAEWKSEIEAAEGAIPEWAIE